MEAPEPNHQPDGPATTSQPAPINNQSAPAPLPAARPRVRIHISANGSSIPQNVAGYRIHGHRNQIIYENVNPLQNQTHRITLGGYGSGLQRIPMPQIMPAPPLPPLEPLPLPHLRSHSNDDDEMKKFECAICFEYLNVPVYCGSCPVRFCKGCLEKVIVQDLQRSATAAAEAAAQYNNTTPAQPSARCPHCRTPINHIQFDYTLQSEMNACSKSIQCPFEGCEAALTLKDLSNHEKSCLFLPLKCRYHQWGCEWSGTLSDLPSHEEVCELNKIKSVIERIRGGHWELSHVMKQYAGFIAIAQGMGMQNRQEILQLRDNAGDFGMC